ncbi:hypothetical protein LSAT2_022123 [Lamellibrachia satsuma]|nr:hypothetical protein LSAT2_022123 [Lamellibrachia satsuma]
MGQRVQSTVGLRVLSTVGLRVLSTVGLRVLSTVGLRVHSTVVLRVLSTVGLRILSTMGLRVLSTVGLRVLSTVGLRVLSTVGLRVLSTVGLRVLSTVGLRVLSTVGLRVLSTVGLRVLSTVGLRVLSTVGLRVNSTVGLRVLSTVGLRVLSTVGCVSRARSAHNGVFTYQWQDRENPANIPNIEAVQFQVCIQNRYKLNKKYRKVLPTTAEEANRLGANTFMAQAKMAADAENDDNISEQRRQHGKRVRYGEVIQGQGQARRRPGSEANTKARAVLKHMFTDKFVHVSTTQTSRRDKNNMLVHLQEYNAKHAQFKILPRYKVKSEGEFVQIFDQITFESVKSPGQFFHASSAWKIDHFTVGSEVNLGIQPAGFTVVRTCRPTQEILTKVRGGSVIRMFHKELEAYIVAEGLFDDDITEDVHLRIREVDQLIPKSLYPPTSANTYWQIEAESSILYGEVIHWEQQVRLRHMTTRHYLSISADRRVTLTPDSKDPRTVFRLHPVIKPEQLPHDVFSLESDEVNFESYARIEHVITGYWLHALRDEEYVRRDMRDSEKEGGDSMKTLRWDGASLRKISASGEKMYHDAYTLQEVEPRHFKPLNYIAGMVPFLLNLILDRRVPLQWAAQFCFSGLQSSTPVGCRVPLQWAAQFHTSGLQSSAPVGCTVLLQSAAQFCSSRLQSSAPVGCRVLLQCAAEFRSSGLQSSTLVGCRVPLQSAAGSCSSWLQSSTPRKESKILNAKKSFKITVALEELRTFMLINGVAAKPRQKLMRNMRVIDLLVRLLRCPLHGAIDQTHLMRVFKASYNVLYTYMIGSSRKNALYFAKYIDFFQMQMNVKLVSVLTDDNETGEWVDRVTDDNETGERVDRVTDDSETGEQVDRVTDDSETGEWVDRVTDDNETGERVDRVTDDSETDECVDR